MDTELLRKKYYGFGGSDSDEWTVFFEDTPEEQSIPAAILMLRRKTVCSAEL